MDRVAAGGAHRVIGGAVELSGLHRDGHEFPVEMSLSTWKIGEEALFTGIIRDITERKRMEAELERARRRMEDELNVGREIQMSMLPLIFPPYPMRHEFDIHATLRPAREVGGDFYDFYLIDEDRLCFVVGDVSGKGVPAALFMAVTKTLIESRARNDSSPASILTHVNNELSRHNDASMFVTVFMGMLDVRTGRLSYANGGHNPPYIKRADGSVTRLRERHGPVLGAMEDMVYREDDTTLERGDRVFVFTDGVTEAMNITQSLYGEPQLVHMLSSETLASAESLVEGVVRDVLRFQGDAEQADDITVLALQYHGGREEEESRVFALTLTNRLDEIQRLNTAFTAFADEHAVPAAARRSGNIVFDELINNVINYAFDDQTEHTIDVRIELTSRRLVISITDDGRPFNPFQTDPPDTALSIDERGIGGLGVHLVRNMMDEVSYNRRTDRNVVTLVKYLDPQHP
jgi:sigma-B regulation protein RsbU (phosphoserine phosphatase)